MLRSHRIALSPAGWRDLLFRQHAGYARYAFNWAIDEFSASLSVGDWCNDLNLRPRFNAVKHLIAPWAVALSQNASKGAIIDAGQAIAAWGQYRQQLKAGQKPAQRIGFPKFKKRGGRMAFRADNGPGTIRFDGKHIILPKAMGGRVRMREALRFDGKVKTVRIIKRGQRWYASATVDDGLPMPEVADRGRPKLGVDVGVKRLASCSDRVMYEAPRPLRRLLKKLKRLNRSLARKVEGSANWHKLVDAIRRLHARIADIRNDAIHKATTEFVQRAGWLKVETLNVRGMMRNRRLSRALADAGMGEVLRQLEYKASWAGVRFERIDRWYPSSQLCNHCGERNDTLKLAQREWWCGGCGRLVDRDFNASDNIRDYESPGAARRQPVETEVGPAAAPAPVCEAGMVTGTDPW